MDLYGAGFTALLRPFLPRRQVPIGSYIQLRSNVRDASSSPQRRFTAISVAQKYGDEGFKVGELVTSEA